MCSFSICDDSNDGHGFGQKVRWFNIQAQLPAITGSGDVVLLRNVKVKNWSGMDLIISNRASKWTVIPHASMSSASVPGNKEAITSLRSNGEATPSPSEVLYARYLHDSRDSSTFTAASELQTAAQATSEPSAAQKNSIASSQAPTVKRDKFSLIKDIRLDTFVDLLGQVVKVYSAMSRVELYVTDYTSNNLLFHYTNPEDPSSDSEQQSYRGGNPYGDIAPLRRFAEDNSWAGPYGKQTLRVALWPPHDEFAVHNLQPGMFVHLRNVRIKYDKNLKVEGNLHTDQRYSSRVDVTIIRDYKTDERCKEVLRRKLAYQQSQKRNMSKVMEGKKRNAVATFDETDNDKENVPEKKSKGEQPDATTVREPPPDETKQQKRKRRKREAAAAQLGASKATSEALPKVTTKLSLNTHIRTQNSSQPPLTLSQILSPREEDVMYTPPSGNTFRLPFSNVKYRTRPVRVIDYFPDNLEQWCMRYKESEMDCLDDDAENQDDTSSKWSSAGSEDEDDSGAENDPSSFSASSASRAFQTQAPVGTRSWKWKWQWRFALRLEDYPPPPKGEKGARMWVFVTKADAEFLLKLDARNMRAGEKGKKLLAQLKEKMFLLWGELEERKSERMMKDEEKQGGEGKEIQKEEIGPRGLPFECCLKEYGVERKRFCKGANDDGRDLGWDRRFAMFGTVIS